MMDFKRVVKEINHEIKGVHTSTLYVMMGRCEGAIMSCVSRNMEGSEIYNYNTIKLAIIMSVVEKRK